MVLRGESVAIRIRLFSSQTAFLWAVVLIFFPRWSFTVVVPSCRGECEVSKAHTHYLRANPRDTANTTSPGIKHRPAREREKIVLLATENKRIIDTHLRA